MTKDKAATELAKLGQQTLKTAENAGRWLDSIFGDGARQIGIAFNDSMSGFRLRNRLRVLQKTQKALEDAGLSGATRPLGERIALPIWDAISEESNDTLQNIWVSYLKNALDPKKPSPDRILIDVIRKLEPGDWPYLQKIFSLQRGAYKKTDIAGNDIDLVPIFDRLAFIGLLEYDIEDKFYISQSAAKTWDIIVIKIGKGEYRITRLLNELKKATEK